MLMNELANQRISVTMDETTDSCGRSILNVLFSYQNKTKLVNTLFLETVNNTTIAQAFVNTIHSYNIPFTNLIFFISDNASYMKKAYTNILFPLIPHLFHNTCFAHIYNLVGETWVDFEHFKLLDIVVKHIKTLFVYSAARKRRWREHLISKSVLLNTNESLFDEESTQDLFVNLPPLPIKTRWNSWFKFLIWMKNYYQHMVTFFIEESVEKNSNAIKELKEIFQNQSQSFYIDILIKFISFNAQR